MAAGNLPYAPAFDHLVYVRVFEGCNLHCEHCFIPANPKRMTLADMAGVAAAAHRFARPGQRLMIQWHGGEPTLFGAAWLEQAIDAVEAAGPEFRWAHGLQTNLMTYERSWGALYHRRFGGEVGVSWDPVIRLMRRGQPDSHAAYEARFWDRMAALLDDGVRPYLVVTAAATLFQAWPNPLAFYRHLYDRGLRRLHLERITETGYARDNWARLGLSNGAYSRHMARWLRAYLRWQQVAQAEGLEPMRVSPFDGLLASARTLAAGGAGGYGCWSGACDTRFHTVDAHGYKRGCTAVTSEADNPRAAVQAGAGLSLEADLTQARSRRRADCARCSFRAICSSGCLALVYEDGSGECSGGRQLFQAALDLIQAERAASVDGDGGGPKNAASASLHRHGAPASLA